MDSPHLPSESSLTDLETGSESGVLQPLSRNHTVSSIVPETPQANSFSSALPPPDSLRESRLKITQIEQLRRIAPSTIPHVGTPSAVGAIRKSSSSLQIATPAVSRGLSSLSRSSIRKGISVEPYMGNDVSLTMDKEFDEEEAQLGLELARARHIVCRLERELAEARCAESIALVGLYKHRAEGARTRHDHAEYDLGLARDLVTRKGSSSWNISVIGKPSAKCPRLASPGSLSGSPEV
ncbi:hypothetical protein EV363DRAFT_1401893 [Boletus edulis]|nr:hypothetical protein EV363DRAFT_1401893 [Boletus edulis]